MKVKIIFLILLVLTGCSAKKPEAEQGKPAPIKMDGTIERCYVHADYYSCTLTSGNTYYITADYAKEVMATKTMWDKTTWRNQT